MFRISLIMAVVAVGCSWAAPAAHIENEGGLLRPSPINPEIPMDPKPAEKITKITNPELREKFQRDYTVEQSSDNGSLKGPTLPPKFEKEPAEGANEKVLHRQKRVESDSTSSTTETNPIRAAESVPFAGAPQSDYVQHRRPEQIPDSVTEFSAPVSPLQPPKQSSTDTEKIRRDIPVPLVPKYHHPEESPKDGEKKEESTDKNENTPDQKTAEKVYESPTTEASKIPVEVEDLYEPTSRPASHHPLSQGHPFKPHAAQISHGIQPESHHATENHTSEGNSVATSTQSSIIRHRPVPVAELFGRLKQAQENHQQQQDNKDHQNKQEDQKNKPKKQKDDDDSSDSSEEEDD